MNKFLLGLSLAAMLTTVAIVDVAQAKSVKTLAILQCGSNSGKIGVNSYSIGDKNVTPPSVDFNNPSACTTYLEYLLGLGYQIQSQLPNDMGINYFLIKEKIR